MEGFYVVNNLSNSGQLRLFRRYIFSPSKRGYFLALDLQMLFLFYYFSGVLRCMNESEGLLGVDHLCLCHVSYLGLSLK